MADYRLTANDVVVRTADNAFIPNDLGNVDRIEYEEWRAAGGLPEVYVHVPFEPPPSPDMLEALRANKRLDDGVVAALNIAIQVRRSMHTIPKEFSPESFSKIKLQLDILTDAFVSLIAAQAHKNGNGNGKSS
jgi:hypothetical protein